ncbi:unnamed protein product [Fraxinus pennsylvanica]|uniref:PSD13 N-terminal domain-containing protein n=1 Tax=Fraxinus pennsylvanica TaxID=56036 RepID=A0AAD2E126_9LAMI|nr:unnamed protein product [Fraxinus pennsylvanica]
MAAFEYLESLRTAHPELSEWYNTLADLYQRKLWHQLTLKLEQFVALPVFQVSVRQPSVLSIALFIACLAPVKHFLFGLFTACLAPVKYFFHDGGLSTVENLASTAICDNEEKTWDKISSVSPCGNTENLRASQRFSPCCTEKILRDGEDSPTRHGEVFSVLRRT